MPIGINEKVLVKLIKAEKKGRILWRKASDFRHQHEVISNGYWTVYAPAFKSLPIRLALFSIFGREIEVGESLVSLGGNIEEGADISGLPKYEPEYAMQVGTLTPIVLQSTRVSNPVRIVEGFGRLTAIDLEYAELPDSTIVYANRELDVESKDEPLTLYFGEYKNVIIQPVMPHATSWEAILVKHAQMKNWTSIDPVQFKDDEPAAEVSDDLYQQVVDYVVTEQQCSVSAIQRKFRVGYIQAAQLVDRMEAEGIVGPFSGMTPREVLKQKQEA